MSTAAACCSTATQASWACLSIYWVCAQCLWLLCIEQVITCRLHSQSKLLYNYTTTRRTCESTAHTYIPGIDTGVRLADLTGYLQ
eukprot:19901-Heterococcus_DN1.PRE.3